MKTIKVGELKDNFSQILRRIQDGEEIVISYGKKGSKVAVLVPYKNYKKDAPRTLGLLKGRASCEITDDFNIDDVTDLKK